MGTALLDPTRAEAFSARLDQMLDAALLTLLTSVGERTGLFEAMAALPPSTSAEIAAAAGLDERFVRKWLAAMAAGGVVDHDGSRRTFALPAEHAAWLTAAAGRHNRARRARRLARLGAAEDAVVDCFRTGAGAGRAVYQGFRSLSGEEAALTFDALLLSTILPLVPGLPERLRAGLDVLDVGCGNGHALCLMAGAFPQSRLLGIDVSEEAVAAARATVSRLPLHNLTVDVRDVATLDAPQGFDLITAFDWLQEEARPQPSLRHIVRALRPGATFVCSVPAAASALADNLGRPLAVARYAVSTLYELPIARASGGDGLGGMCGIERCRRLLVESGLAAVSVHQLPADPLRAYLVASAPPS